MYKLVCIDMDGTLLNDDKIISERNLKALKDAALKGVRIAVSTGRMFTSADYYADMIGIKVPVICSNGAYIREKDRNEVVYKSLLSEEICMKIYNILKKYNMYGHFNTCDSILTEKIMYSSQAYMNMNKMLPKDNQINIVVVEDWKDAFNKYNNEILKCIAVDTDLEKLSKARAEMEELDGIEVVSSLYNNFEVMNKGVSKGRAVEMLADFYNISKEEIICIGDNENDISMLKFASLGVAMGNGEDIAKEAADYVTDTNNNHGVAKVIEKFIL